ncbi:trypsin-like peptidase [Tahibacter aquaticus]|uniref:Trypsin-like peptidase n=2 Tax=Tahibacter aquaticus TaxID=520092 RepID=A0A4R6Z0A4_9GAMM|nr:trypsin-like peptidase [Tahibacter aquaticus]
MMDIRRGIVRITAGGDRGTGFLVRDAQNSLCILTAMHVVADVEASIAAGSPQWRASHATVAFHEQSSIAIDLAAVEQSDAREDWVMLPLHAERRPDFPDSLSPLTLAQLSDSSAQPLWKTHGYPYIDAHDGTPIGGTIRAAHDGEIVLFCTELQMSEAALAAGYSGAPCIWEGAVVGVIIETLKDEQGQCVFGRLYARPIASIARRCNLPLESDEEPFEREVAAELYNLPPPSLKGVAQALNIDPEVQADVLLSRIARAVLRAGSAELCNAISLSIGYLANPQAIAEMSVAQKLCRRAVEVLHCLRQRESLCVAAVARREGAKMLVARALNRYGDIDRHLGFMALTEFTASERKRKLREQLLLLFNAEESEMGEAQLERLLRENVVNPVMAFAYDPRINPRDVVASYANVHALLLLDEHAPTELLRSRYPVSQPYKDADEEKSVFDSLNDARLRLRRKP